MTDSGIRIKGFRIRCILALDLECVSEKIAIENIPLVGNKITSLIWAVRLMSKDVAMDFRLPGNFLLILHLNVVLHGCPLT